MADIIEIEIPTGQIYASPDEFTSNPSYDSHNWSKDRSEVPATGQGQSGKHRRATNWLSIFAVVVAVGAMAVAVVTGFVLKPECSCNETDTSQVITKIVCMVITKDHVGSRLLVIKGKCPERAASWI